MADAAAPASAPVGRLEFSMGTPDGWFRMPEPGAPEGSNIEAAPAAPNDDWIEAVVAKTALGGREADELCVSLGRALRQAERQHRPGRLRLVYVGIPARPAVQAWASVDLFAANGVTPDAFETAVREGASATARGAEVWHREVSRTQLGGFEAVTTHDLLTFRGSGDSRVQHRFVATAFVAQSDQIVQLQLSTPNLAAFDDLEAVGRSMADSIVVRPTAEGAVS